MVTSALEYELSVVRKKLAQTEQALVRAEHLALAGRFAATVMHEINNPLEAVTNFAYLMHTEPLTETVSTYLTLMEEQLSRLREIARQTLILYRASEARQLADLTYLVRVALRVYARPLLDKKIMVKLDLPASAHHLVFPAQLTQAISNLISNAIDAMEQGGQLSIRLRSMTSMVHITICDSGSGVPLHMRQTLFEAFASGKAAGHGLGLWICRRAIDQHQGKILWRTSTKMGKSGTIFRLSLVGARAMSQAA